LVVVLGRGISPTQDRTAQHGKMQTHTSKTRAGFEPTIPVYVPQSARPLGLAEIIILTLNCIYLMYFSCLSSSE